MADYSGYKIKRTHSLTPLTSVFEAEAADGRPGRFALKVFHPPASTNARRTYAIEGWLLAAERQQQSAKKDGAVLEVLAFGRCEEGAFAVYPWQERFLEPLIKTIGAKGNTLRALAECLLNTVEKWETQTGGPHGNLKPANVFLNRTGPLAGMTAQLSDPAFLPGATTDALRQADLVAVGTMLATIVRRRPPGAWPIEEAPEWKALGNAGKGWLDYCNYLLNPQPGEGEVTLAKARLRLKKVPKDANPVRTAILTGTTIIIVATGSILGFARFGNPDIMPFQIRKLAETVRNPRAFRENIGTDWPNLCRAWDTWLIDLQNNAGRLNRTNDLWAPNDQLKTAIATFMARANQLRPETLVPEAAAEKRLGVLGDSPPDVVRNELLKGTVAEAVTAAWTDINTLRTALERWQRWDEMRTLLKRIEDSRFARAAAALAPKLPQAPGTEGYKLDAVRTLKLFNDISLDDTGTLPLASRWSEISHLTTEMEESRDRIQIAMPDLILGRLTDLPSISDFADSLVSPLEEMRKRRKQFLDPQVVRDRFLKESPLQAESAKVALEDFERWDKELYDFTLVPAAEDPRLPPAADAIKMDDTTVVLRREAGDLETTAPEGETGQPVTLNIEVFTREFATLTANLQSFRARAIVRREVPKIAVETTQLAGVFEQLSRRLTYTLSLLDPNIWLVKVRQPYGTFTESTERWRAWLATIANVTGDSLKGTARRPEFRRLRDNERKLKEWIDGLEGPTGFGALKVPDLAAPVSTDASTELKRLEGVRREKAAADVGAATTWTNALPAPAWAEASANMRLPLEKHSGWLAQLPDFAKNLDDLSRLLTDGFGWTEGVQELDVLISPLTGADKLTGKPGLWTAEARALQELAATSDRAGLTAAAQSGGLSRKLMAWRKLGTLADWPAGPVDFRLDGAVVARMRELVGRDVKNEDRRTTLFDEMVQQTKRRFNRAALAAARVEAQLTDMFNLMTGAGIAETDLAPKVAYNLATWRLKRADRNEKNMNRLRERRDAFVNTVKAIPTEQENVTENEEVKKFLAEISAIELKDDPNRVATTSPATAGWQEEVTNEGFGLTATWKSGTRTVRLDYAIVQPQDDTPPFFLAKRAVAVGEFLDLMAGRPKEDTEAVMKELPPWAQRDAPAKPYDMPLAWKPRDDFKGLELNGRWFYINMALTGGLLDENSEARAASPVMEQVATEKPTLRSPLQNVTSSAAKLFVEKALGARLPTTKEWNAVIQATGATATNGHFRGPKFQQLFEFVRDYRGGGQVQPWRPNVGIFAPTMKDIKNDDGRAIASTDQGPLWFRSVDDGPSPGGFVNLIGNVSIFVAGDTSGDFHVAGGSVLSPPGIDFTQPHKIVAAGGLIGGRVSSQAYSDVGIRPAFDAPPGFRERYKLLMLVRGQKYLTL